MRNSRVAGCVQWRKRFAALLVMAVSVSPGGAARARDAIRYDGGVRFVTDAEFPQGPCLFLLGMMTAPDFFAGLERKETPYGVEYRRSSRVVTEFPEEVIVRLRIREFPCHTRVNQDEGASPPQLTLETMSSLRFEAQWKRGMKMQPVESLTLRTFFEEKDEPLLFARMPAAVERSAWNYELVVASKSVPLTDHLILSIFTPDGRRLARVSVRL